jgi:hypothetical protein
LRVLHVLRRGSIVHRAPALVRPGKTLSGNSYLAG